ncbi:Response regulator receiver modulated diguanylate cyclase (fragment) [Desulfamplus magnetovallimortis]|uniref:diguanylate cyclase n=2 Tax=Desulfamplus magnetovallimortis TaxID=1246637 RepID=A0A1W1HCF0_9BACT
MDIIMPEMDGYELCGKLKEDPLTSHIPVIFVTAVSEIMDENRGFALGAVDYITKPFHPPMVKARVKLHLNLKRKQELLEKFAFIDALTEIPNRRQFDSVLEQEWNRAIRSSYPISLILADIDHFKLYNDTYGHGKGDDCLHNVAQAMSRSLRRSSDFVARYGGEEFAVVLPDTDAFHAIETANNLLASIDRMAIPHESSPVADCVTVSMGVSTMVPDTENCANVKNLIEDADKKLYEAKSSGRHVVIGY